MSALPTPARSGAACAAGTATNAAMSSTSNAPRRLTGANVPRSDPARAACVGSVSPMHEVRDLTKRFGANVAVDGLSFKATPGRVLGFLGPNGAGKTTTLRTLLGLTLPTSGAATVDSRPYRELEDPVKVVGAVLEGPQFHPGRTGRNHLRVLAAPAGLTAGRVDEMLSLVELNGAGRRRVKGYSLGMRQRL